jgi:hypothetical protein
MDEEDELTGPAEPYEPPAVIYEGRMATRAGTPPTGCPPDEEPCFDAELLFP